MDDGDVRRAAPGRSLGGVGRWLARRSLLQLALLAVAVVVPIVAAFGGLEPAAAQRDLALRSGQAVDAAPLSVTITRVASGHRLGRLDTGSRAATVSARDGQRLLWVEATVRNDTDETFGHAWSQPYNVFDSVLLLDAPGLVGRGKASGAGDGPAGTTSGECYERTTWSLVSSVPPGIDLDLACVWRQGAGSPAPRDVVVTVNGFSRNESFFMPSVMEWQDPEPRASGSLPVATDPEPDE